MGSVDELHKRAMQAEGGPTPLSGTKRSSSASGVKTTRRPSLPKEGEEVQGLGLWGLK